MRSLSTGRSSRATERSQRGFSLIEIMIAMAVSLIGLAGLMSLYVSISKSNQRATNLVIASSIAQQTMEELRSMPLFPPTVGYDGPTIQSEFGIPISDFRIVPDIVRHANTSYRRFVTVDSLGSVDPQLADLFRLRIVVAWSDDGANEFTADTRLQHSMALETIRTRQDLL